MTIRPATADDWSQLWPIFANVVEAGETCAYPEDLISDQARDLWLWQDLGFEIVGTVPVAFDSRKHGLVGLHVMFLAL